MPFGGRLADRRQPRRDAPIPPATSRRGGLSASAGCRSPGGGPDLRVDTLAQGVVEAAKKTNVKVPVILRLEGTNVEQGREILKQSGLNFIIGETMQDAAAKAVKAAKDYAAKK